LQLIPASAFFMAPLEQQVSELLKRVDDLARSNAGAKTTPTVALMPALLLCNHQPLSHTCSLVGEYKSRAITNAWPNSRFRWFHAIVWHG